jgi:hypothetical protein
MALPPVSSMGSFVSTLKIWQQKLNPGLISPPQPRTPFNFRASGGPTGANAILLNWEQVRGADGYQIQMSTTPDFSNATIVATLRSPVATAWVDVTDTTGAQRWYRIRSTAGTVRRRQSVVGIWSAPVSSTSGNNSTTYDQTSGSSGPGGWNRPTAGSRGSRLLQL